MRKYKMPKKKQSLITNKFLNIFKEELIKTFEVEEELTWENHIYYWVDSCNWSYSFKRACNRYGNNGKGLYRYYQRLEPCRWDNQYDSDTFDYELGLMLLDRGIISKGKEDNWDKILENDEDYELVETREKYKGYTVISKKWGFKE